MNEIPDYQKKVKTNVKAEIDLGVDYHIFHKAPEKNDEEYIESMERAAKELEDFLRDHRSRDNYKIYIRWETEVRCIFCGHAEEWGGEEPGCCQKAIDAYEKELKNRNK